MSFIQVVLLARVIRDIVLVDVFLIVLMRVVAFGSLLLI